MKISRCCEHLLHLFVFICFVFRYLLWKCPNVTYSPDFLKCRFMAWPPHSFTFQTGKCIFYSLVWTRNHCTSHLHLIHYPSVTFKTNYYIFNYYFLEILWKCIVYFQAHENTIFIPFLILFYFFLIKIAHLTVYFAQFWVPHNKKDIELVFCVQRRATKLVKEPDNKTYEKWLGEF